MNIPGSISSTLNLSYQVVNYLKAVMKSDKERGKILNALETLNKVLSELVNKAHAPELEGTLDSLRQVDGPLQKLNEMLEGLQTKICPSTHKTWYGKTKMKLLWPFNQDEVQKMESDIEALKSTLNLRLHTCHMYAP